MSLEQHALDFVRLVGQDIRSMIQGFGTLDQLTTTQKSTLVEAINEVNLAYQQIDITALFDDTNVSTINIWSADKIVSALNSLKQQMLDGAPEAFDTLAEIADYLAANTNQIGTILTSLGYLLRYDASQSLTGEEKTTACDNIGIGEPDFDLAQIYYEASDINTYVAVGYVKNGYVR